MMDGLTAVGLATGVLQIVDFTTKLVSHIIELHKSGKEALKDHLIIDNATLRLTELVNDLNLAAPNGGFSAPKELAAVATACLNDAAELRDVLVKCKRKDDSRKSLLSAAIRTVLGGNKAIEALQTRLGQYRQEIHTYLLVLHRQDLSNVTAIIEQSQQENRTGQQSITGALKVLRTQYDNREAAQLHQIKATENVLLSAIDEIKDADLQARLMRIQLQSKDQAESEAIRQQRFLDDLYHPVLSRRERQVIDRAEYTFEWMFDTWTDQHNYNDCYWSTGFVDWLAGDQSLYWITGKPGAGKSTLMKFIAQDFRTRFTLQMWADSKTLVIVNAYFWISGDYLQRSLCGLLRCLLHQILNQCRDLFPILFPREWRLYERNDYQQTQWLEEDLVSAMEILSNTQSLEYKFCLFIDGLDEYEDIRGLGWLNKFFIKLSQSNHIKLCISSRPWQEFELAFSKNPSIKIDEWTTADIHKVVCQELEQHPYWKDIVISSPDKSAQILNDITDRADGVFLWVFLVVRSIEEGLIIGESAEYLLQRTKEMPQGLEGHFSRIMAQLQPKDRHKTGKALWLCLHSSPVRLSWLEHISEFAPDFAEGVSPKPYTLEQLDARGRSLKRFVTTHCKDLLYVYEDPYHGKLKTVCAEVMFTHRSVRDYLETAEARSVLELPFTITTTKYVHWSCQVLLMEIKSLSTPHLGIPIDSVLEALVQIFGCQKVWPQDYEPSVRYLDDLYHSVQSAHSSGNSGAGLFSRWISDETHVIFRHFLSWTACLGCKSYVRTKMLAEEFFMDIGSLEEVVLGALCFRQRLLTSGSQYTGVTPDEEIMSVIQQVSKNLFDQGLNSQYLELKNGPLPRNLGLDARQVYYIVDRSGNSHL